MSSFQDVLEEHNKDSTGHLDGVPDSKKRFSFRYFVVFICIFLGFFIGILGWAFLQKEATIQKLKKSLPSKTVLLERQNTTSAYDGKKLTMKPVTSEISSKAKLASSQSSANGAVSQTILPAPAQGLSEKNQAGQVLPIKRKSDGLTVFEAYKMPVENTEGKPLLSIVVYDVGLSAQQFYQLVDDLPAYVTFSISPYSSNAKALTDYAREDGHEIWVTLPLETKDYPVNDPGPLTLLTQASLQQNTRRLHTILSRTQGYVGVISQKDHRYASRDVESSPYIKEIFERGLGVFESNAYASSFVKPIAERKGYPYAKNDFWFDDDLSPLAFNQKIRRMIEFGQASGRVTVLMRPYPASLKAMNKFLTSAALQRFNPAPLSAQMR